MPRLPLSRLTLPTLAAALVLSAVPALAQPAHPAPPPSPTARVDTRIAHLRAKLGITKAELPEWNALAAVMRENAATMQHAWRVRSADVDHMTALQILESYRHFARVHVAALDRLVPAFRHLYAVLTPAQRSRVDDMFQDRAAKHAGHH
jgi:Spy/CpxP family protein refolding chaperone